MEEWRNIYKLENYEVSNFGKIRNKMTNRLMHQTFTNNAVHVYLRQDNKQKGRVVARLVAAAFVDNPHNYKYIKHLDDNPKNNKSTNIKFVRDSRKAKTTNRRQYKEYSERLIPDYTFLEKIKTIDRAQQKGNKATIYDH